MKVLKFGGKCLKDAGMFLKTAEIVENEREEKVIVVSAVEGETDLLREHLKCFDSAIEPLMQKVRAKHEQLVLSAIEDKKILDQIVPLLNENLQKLERLLYGIAYTEELTPKTKDLCLSFGERLAAPILEGILKSKNINAKVFESDKIGMLTDDVFGSATALLPEIEENFQRTIIPSLEKGLLPIITGFFGSNKKGEVTTFGRGGSDYSAAVVAYALNARLLELWKDVAGFMTADPDLVKTARRIDKLSYEEAGELAYFGAGIMHPRTVEPASEKDIPILIRNIHRPLEEGTRIVASGYEKKEIIKSVASREDLGLIKVYGKGAGYKPGTLSEIYGSLGNAGINIYSATTSQTCVSLLVKSNEIEKGLETLAGARSGLIEKIESSKEVALICAVGENLGYTKGLAARIFTILAQQGINIELISAGASKVAFHFTVAIEDLRKALRALHYEFFEK